MKSPYGILKFMRRHLGMSIFCLTITAGAVCSIAKALETSTLTSQTDTDSADVPITTEEIDKIIEDLKISGSIDNIIKKLDEIIYRAQLSGNSALQEYATNMKSSYELQKQLDSVNSLIESMKKKNKNVAAVDEQVRKIMSVNTIAADLDGAVSDEALLVIKSLDNEKTDNLKETLAEIESLFDLSDVGQLSVRQRSLLDIIILSRIIEDNMVDGDRLALANDTLAVAVTILESYQKQDYPSESYNKLTEGTEKFIKSAKKASSVLPEQTVFFDGHFNITHSPIMYDGHILMALDDLYQYIDASIEYMYGNATMVITSPDRILEITSGKNVAYLNDKPYNLPTPILSFDDVLYMPVEFFAQAYDISYKFLPDYDFLILYKNLVQLENENVPNKLSRS